MRSQRVLNALTRLGLSKTDAKVYIYLAKNGPSRAIDIGDALKLEDDPLCGSLRNLKSKGIVAFVFQQSNLFYARPFEEVLEVLVKASLIEAEETEQARDEILFLWRTMTKARNTDERS